MLPFALLNLEDFWSCPNNGRKKKQPKCLSQFQSAMTLELCRCSQLTSKCCTCGRSPSAFSIHCCDFFHHFHSPPPTASPAASPSLCPSLRCCLASGHLGQIIILKLKWAVWTQNWGMNCLIELAAVAAFPAARTELFALSSSHPHLGA